MINDKYFLNSREEIGAFCKLYFPLLKAYSEKVLGTNLTDKSFAGDHLGVQTSSPQEYDHYNNLLSNYMDLLFTNTLHKRRISVFAFRRNFEAEGIQLKGIEIFEPKPGADSSKLKLGIEHLAITVEDFDSFQKSFPKIYIEKIVDYPEGRFLKTKFMNLVEIEFRDKSLIDKQA